jgi:hypothetical protein
MKEALSQVETSCPKEMMWKVSRWYTGHWLQFLWNKNWAGDVSVSCGISVIEGEQVMYWLMGFLGSRWLAGDILFSCGILWNRSRAADASISNGTSVRRKLSGLLLLGCKAAGEWSWPPGVQVNSTWSSTPTPPYIFMA